jgi:hypothetical protein
VVVVFFFVIVFFFIRFINFIASLGCRTPE